MAEMVERETKKQRQGAVKNSDSQVGIGKIPAKVAKAINGSPRGMRSEISKL